MTRDQVMEALEKDLASTGLPASSLADIRVRLQVSSTELLLAIQATGAIKTAVTNHMQRISEGKGVQFV